MRTYYKKILCIAVTLTATLLYATGCREKDNPETPEEKKSYIITSFGSTDMPELIPFNGGEYTLNFDTEILTKTNTIFEPWLLRVTVGNEEIETMKIEEETSTLKISIPENYSENIIPVRIDMAYDNETPEWKNLIDTQEDAGLINACGFLWAKGNIDIKDGKFIFADNMYDTGLLFKHGSKYGVKPEKYSGTAYTPEPVNISLADIKADAGEDPCKSVSEKFRTPSHLELYNLYYYEDKDKSPYSLGGVKGFGYQQSDFFMPMGGYVNIGTGEYQGQSQYGAYWGLGGNYSGDGVLYSFNDEYSYLYFDAMRQNMASVRCVVDLKQPSYISHSPSGDPADYKEFSLTVKVDPGEFPLYDLQLEASDGESVQAAGTKTKTDVALKVPANESKEARNWKLFINQQYSGIEFNQPGISNYVFYISHTPKEVPDGKAFTLKVKCETDLSSFPVVIKSSDGLEWSGEGSAANPEVSIEIPENNTSVKRTLEIWVNGENTGKTVIQEILPKEDPLVVEWSTGYLTVSNGKYIFAPEGEKGMFFKYNSRYAIPIGTYEGKAYGPDETEIAYADIPANEVDPCTLVEPAGTWRIPSEAEIQNLIDSGDTKEKGKIVVGEEQYVFAPTGMFNAKSMKVLAPNTYVLWTSTKDTAKEDCNKYMLWSSNTPKVAGGITWQNAMPVRCVKDK